MKLSEFYEKYGDQNIDEKELKQILGIKDQKYFKPKYGERYYYYINTLGEIYEYVWFDDETDYTLYLSTELYRTKEDAFLASKKNQFLLQMKRDFEDNSDVIDWEDGKQLKYYVYFDYEIKSLSVSFAISHKGNDLYTTNEEWLEQYIKDNKDNIKKHYFEIKEKQND